MNTKLMKTCIVAAALLLPMAAYTADYDTDRSSPKVFVKDAVITSKIKAKLAAERLASVVNIRVDTDNNGVVTLSGRAASRDEMEKAVSIASNVDGVAAVENNIQIAASDSRYSRDTRDSGDNSQSMSYSE